MVAISYIIILYMILYIIIMCWIRMKLKITHYITEVRLYFCPFQEVTVYVFISILMKCKNICICKTVRAQVLSNGRKY